MNETPQSQDSVDLQKLARAIRFALVVIVLGLSYLNAKCSFSIGSFAQMFAEMLGGQPLPDLTLWVISARPIFVTTSVLIPLVAISTLFFRNLVKSFYIIGVLGFVTMLQPIILFHALSAPLAQIIISMSSVSAP